MKPIRILTTTDIHGSLFPITYHDNAQANLGLGRLASYIRAQKKADPSTCYIDNGDVLQGSPLIRYALAHNIRPNVMAEAFNQLQADFYNLGNHDFNFGQQPLTDYIADMQAELLCGNVLKNGVPLGQSRIIRIHNLRIALIGCVTQYIPNWERPEYLEGLTFINALEYMKQEVARLAPLVDVVIGVYHGGLERDPQDGQPTERLTGENLGYAMCAEIDDLDVLISGHQHRSLNTRIHGTLLTQCAFNGQEMAEILIDPLSKKTSATLIQAASLPIDEDFLSSFTDLEQAVQTDLDRPLATTTQDLRITDPLHARLYKAPFVSLINQIQLQAAPMAQLSACALFNDAFGFDKTIRMRDVVANYPYPNTLVVKRMSGKAIRLMLEKNAEVFTIHNREIVFNQKYLVPKKELYNYDMVDGIDYTFRISRPFGERLISCQYQGQEIKDDDQLTIVMNNYRASGGGDFTMVAEAETIEELPVSMVDLMVDYLQKHPLLQVDIHNNIHILY